MMADHRVIIRAKRAAEVVYLDRDDEVDCPGWYWARHIGADGGIDPDYYGPFPSSTLAYWASQEDDE